MTEFLELIPVELPPFLDSITQVAVNEMVEGRHGEGTTTSFLLNSIRNSLGNLWLPAYLPVGFDADLAEVTNIDNRQHPDLIFRNSDPTDEKQGGHLILSVDRAEDHKHEYVPNHLDSHWDAVVVGGRDGIFIRGGWLIELDKNGTVRSSGWEANHTCRLVLKDPDHDQIITIEARPASLVTEDELLRIAESLKLSRIHRSWLPWLNGR